MSVNPRVGVLSLHNSKETKSLLNTLEKMGYDAVWLREENISSEVDRGRVTVTPEVDVVINRLMLSNAFRPTVDLGLAYLYEGTAEVLNPPAAVSEAVHKFASAAKMAEEDIPIPRSVLGIGGPRLESMKERVIPPKPETGDDDREHAVHKLPIGTHGEETAKVEKGEMVPQLSTNKQGILQQLIENPHTRHNDVRVYVVGDEVIGAMRRYAPEEDWRTNVARGGAVEDVSDTLDEEVYDIAVKTTKALDLDYAGIDLVKGKNQWYVLEANPTAGFKGFFDATGRNPAPHIIKHAVETVGGSIDDELVEQLETVLDDSIPTARPPLRRRPDPQSDTVGYTERVQVCGQQRSEVVIAKSDTGATRTSIDTELAGRIGAGPILDVTSVKSGASSNSKTRPLVEVSLRIGDYTHDVVVNVEDRSHMEHPVLLGRDILDSYSVNVRRRHDEEAENKEESVEDGE